MTKLIRFEFMKVFNRGKWLFFAAILFAKLLFAFLSLNLKTDFSVEVYREYTNQLAGMSESEASEFILAESERINSIIAASNEMEEKYMSGEISIDDYKKYRTSYYDANSKIKAFEELYKRYEQFQELEPKNRIYFYDLSWNLFGRYLGFDFFVFFTVVLFCIPVFCREHSDNVCCLNEVSKFGRRKLCFAKITVCFTIGAVAALVLYASDFAVLALRFGMDFADMPIQAVIGYGAMTDDVTVLTFFVGITASKVLWCICAALAAAAVSAVIKEYVLSLIVYASVILIPLQFSAGEQGMLGKIGIGPGLQGNFYHFSLLVPALNIVLWLAVNYVIVAIKYPNKAHSH